MAKQSTKRRATRSSPTVTVGRTGRRNQLRNIGIDDPLLKEFRGTRAIRTIDRMLIDPIVAGMVERSALLMRAPNWFIEPKTDDDLDHEFADFVMDNFDSLEGGGWKAVLSESAEMIGFGFYPFETLFKQEGDGSIRWSAFSPRDPRTVEDWDINRDTGEIVSMVQRTDTGTARVPWWKMINLSTRSTVGRPWGRTMLRGAFLPWTDKQELRRIIKVGVRRDLTGLAKLEVPPDILSVNPTDDQSTARRMAEELVRGVERDEREGIVLPAEEDSRGQKTGYKFALVSTGGRRQIDLEAIQKFYNREIAIAIIAEFMLLGHEEVGSFALASTKTTMYALALDAILDGIGDHMERHAIPVLRGLNPRFHKARIPKVKHTDIEELPVKEFADAVSKFIKVGAITPDAELEAALRRRVRVPQQPGEKPVTGT